jgi:glyoxalase family protein
MLDQIKGLHHVTSMARDAQENNSFFTHKLGLRRVKKTVNFDAPDVYHLYYGDEQGTPGSVMTYFPFPNIGPRRGGAGEVGSTVFAVPEGSLGFWRERLAAEGVSDLSETASFGEKRLVFTGPDKDEFALVEAKDDARQPWTKGTVAGDEAIRGFHSVSLRLRDGGATSRWTGRAPSRGSPCRAAMARTSSTSRRSPATAPISAPARSTTSPSRSRIGHDSSRSARR